MKNILNRLGQLFIVGFPGKYPPDAYINFISEEKLGGVILFKDNCPTHNTIRSNIELLNNTGSGSPLFIAVDQEGGRVSRLRGAPAEIASAWEYGNKLGLEKFAEDYNRCILFLESLGINLNLAPVCDIYINDKNSCLNDRCFGDSNEKVIPFVKKALEISKYHKMLSCVKHFPGLGASEIDPHENVAEADYDMVIWEQREKTVFSEAINAGTDMIMTTHIHLPNIDKTIATGSKKIVHSLLREMLGFDGLVITDDLTMKGASSLGDIGERTVSAFNAGHDVLLFGQDFETAMIAYDYFCDAFARGKISKERVLSSLERIAGQKFKLGKSIML